MIAILRAHTDVVKRQTNTTLPIVSYMFVVRTWNSRHKLHATLISRLDLGAGHTVMSALGSYGLAESWSAMPTGPRLSVARMVCCV